MLPPCTQVTLASFNASTALETRRSGASVPVDDFAAWTAACQRLIVYALRLIEAQLAAGNSGPGMLLPDKDLFGLVSLRAAIPLGAAASSWAG